MFVGCCPMIDAAATRQTRIIRRIAPIMSFAEETRRSDNGSGGWQIPEANYLT